VEQSPAIQVPDTHAQLLSVTVTLVSFRGPPAKVIPSSIFENAYASGPALGKFAGGPFFTELS
jgi:hypothetical protein